MVKFKANKLCGCIVSKLIIFVLGFLVDVEPNSFRQLVIKSNLIHDLAKAVGILLSLYISFFVSFMEALQGQFHTGYVRHYIDSALSCNSNQFFVHSSKLMLESEYLFFRCE